MTAYTGTIVSEGRGGELGQQFSAIGKYALTGALVNGDTITWSNLLPKNTVKVIAFRFWSVELDTGGTPTTLFTIGDGTDPDGYLTSKGGAVTLSNSLAGQLSYFGDGALIGADDAASRDVVLTVTAAVATGATSGTLWVEVLLEGL